MNTTHHSGQGFLSIYNWRSMYWSCGVAILLFFAICRGTAPAATMVMHFIIPNLTGHFGTTAPTDPVVGQILWEAQSISDPIEYFYSIDLTLDGHKYRVDEIGYLRGEDNGHGQFYDQIGGLAGTASAMFPYTDDFNISWNRNNFADADFLYTTANSYDGFGANRNLASFTITPVPEPSVVSLLATGLFCWGYHKLRRRPDCGCS